MADDGIARAALADTCATPIVDRNATEDSPFSFTLPANTFADVDAGDTLTYSATKTDGSALPLWLSFAAVTRTFSGTPANADVATLAVRVNATDGSNATVTDYFHIVVAITNDAPTVANAIADQNATEDSPFSFTLPADTFDDVDAGDTRTYSATQADDSALPSWLSFNTSTREFSGTPLNGDVGTLSVKVTATDTASAAVSDTFDVVVAKAPTISVTLDGNGNLVISDTDAVGMDNQLSLSRDADGNIVVSDANERISTNIAAATLADGNKTLTVASTEITGTKVIVQGNGGSDHLTVDVSYALFAVEYAGGTGTSDSLTIASANSVSSVTHVFTNGSDGSVSISLDASTSQSISYTGLEPITDNLSAAMRVFTFGDAADSVVLDEDPAAQDMRIDSNNSEVVTFANPTTTLTINAGAGNDTVNVAALHSSFAATIVISGGLGADQLLGGPGNDVLNGEWDNDVLAGGDGNDTVQGGAGNDLVFGGAGHDALDGGDGNDEIKGQGGHDTVVGGAGNDSLDGGAGDDSLVGDAGNDVLVGGADNDTAQGGAGDDTVVGQAGNDLLDGGEDNDIVFGSEGDDLLNGSSGDDTVGGGDASDLLFGGSGNDALLGGAGDDLLKGQAGYDTVAGGDGNDSTSDATNEVIDESFTYDFDALINSI